MTDLIRRPTRGPGRPAAPPADAPGRSLSAAAAVAGAIAALSTLAICLACALVAWFLADGGAHGSTTDALRVGAVAWLVGHGSHVTVAGTPVGMVPLGLTVLLVFTAFRSGRSAARGAEPLDDDRTLGGAAGVFVCGYVVIAVVVGVLGSQAGASISLPRTILGAILVAGLGGGFGLASGSGRLDEWAATVPEWVRQVVAGAVAGALALVAAGALLVGVALLFSFNEGATVLSSLDLSTGSALSLTFVMALFAPNAALLGSSYLLGPGFAFGVGTTVSPTAVSLGVVPAFPVLAALPADGPTPGWLVVAMATPALCAAIGTWLAWRDAEPAAYDVAALRGAGAGLGAGVLVTIAIALAGGALGSGRLADIGAPTAEVLVFATGMMCVGGLLGAIASTWWQNRAERRR